MNEWNIQSRAHACQACGKAFADKQSYHTLLFDEKRDLTRLDICQECWQGQFSQGATELTVGFNWYLNKYVRLQFNYEHDWFDQPVQLGPGASGRVKDQDTLLTRLQLNF